MFLSSRKYNPGCSSWIRILIFYPSRIRDPGFKKARIPDPQHCMLAHSQWPPSVLRAVWFDRVEGVPHGEQPGKPVPPLRLPGTRSRPPSRRPRHLLPGSQSCTISHNDILKCRISCRVLGISPSFCNFATEPVCENASLKCGRTLNWHISHLWMRSSQVIFHI